MQYIIPLVVGLILGYFIASKKHGRDSISKQQEEPHFVETSRGKKEQGKQMVLESFKTQQSLTNNDVEAMLDISDATATRYFDELEKEGKVRQVGKTGRYVSYERI